MEFDFVRQRIAQLRIDKGISKEEMAQKLGMDRRNYERIENASHGRKHLDLDLLHSIAEAHDMSLGELLFPNGLYFAPVQTNSPANVTFGVFNDNITVHPAAWNEELEGIITELKEIINEQRTVIKEQRDIINNLQCSKAD